jgi:hypothetical protein
MSSNKMALQMSWVDMITYGAMSPLWFGMGEITLHKEQKP